MKGPFVKIKTSSESVYVNTDLITSIEDAGTGSAIIITKDRTFYSVTEVNNVPCKSIDDTAKALNDTYENFQSMEKAVAITTSTETVGVKIKNIESIYEDTEGIISIQTVNSTLHNVIEVNGIHCENVEDVVSEINDTIENY